ncbi:MAG: hypothetical protein ACJ761_07925, partial [Chloroflexota bacterium]
MPRSFQARLTVAFFAVIALTLVLVTALVLNRLDDYFTRQQETDLALRADTVASFVTTLADQAAADAGNQPVVSPTDELNPAVGSALGTRSARAVIADQLGQADVRIEVGLFTRRSGDLVFIPAHQAVQLALQAAPAQGQVREPTSWS